MGKYSRKNLPVNVSGYSMYLIHNVISSLINANENSLYSRYIYKFKFVSLIATVL